MKTIWIVLLKELRESLRDRRTLLNALLVGPLLGPVLFVVLMKTMINREVARAEKPLPVVVIGAEYAPNLIAALQQSGMAMQAAIEEPEAAVRAQQVDVVLRIPESYADNWRAGKSAQVELIYDSSRRDTGSQIQRLRGMLNRYAQLQGSLRVVARGLSPEITRPLLLADRDQATPQARGALLFAMLPYMLIFAALMGGMFLAIDATAGERERQSLEPLLINPVSRSHILLGKLGAIGTFSLSGVLLGLIAFTVAAKVLATGPISVPVVLNLEFALRWLPLMLPLIALIAVLQVLVTAFAKTFREAQTWLGLLQLLPVIPLMIVTVLQVKPVLWMYAVPLLGQELAALQLLRGAPVTLMESGLCALSTLVVALATFKLAQRVYASERLAIAV
ncbi:MAG: ABC transporter permease [Steroidobacteraceae bacterium]